jgi:hypothetical protein
MRLASWWAGEWIKREEGKGKKKNKEKKGRGEIR